MDDEAAFKIRFALADEINNVLHTDFVRSDCKYRVIFKPPDPGMPQGYFVIRRELRYIVTNLLNRKTTFVARSAHSEDIDLVAAGWENRNFHLQLMIDDKQVALVPGKNLFVEPRNFTRLEHEISLEPWESRSISLHGEEPCRVSTGRNTYLQATPVLGIEVEVWNDYKGVIGTWDIHMNHPGADEVRANGIGRFVLSRAFLPGQGFQSHVDEGTG